MKFNSLYLYILMIFLIAGCNQENDCPVLSEEYFPNSVGNWWEYDRFDSLSMQATILRVEIVRDSVWKDGRVFRMWVFGKSNMYDTLFVRSTPDSVMFYRYPDGMAAEVMPIPLKTGLGWTHPFFIRDSTQVVSKDTVAVRDILYSNAYRINRRLFAFNDYMNDTRWVVPYLGIVKLENWHYLFGWISKENWQLREFSVR